MPLPTNKHRRTSLRRHVIAPPTEIINRRFHLINWAEEHVRSHVLPQEYWHGIHQHPLSDTIRRTTKVRRYTKAIWRYAGALLTK